MKTLSALDTVHVSLRVSARSSPLTSVCMQYAALSRVAALSHVVLFPELESSQLSAFQLQNVSCGAVLKSFQLQNVSCGAVLKSFQLQNVSCGAVMTAFQLQNVE